VVLTIEG